jgi:hypothetical protein
MLEFPEHLVLTVLRTDSACENLIFEEQRADGFEPHADLTERRTMRIGHTRTALRHRCATPRRFRARQECCSRHTAFVALAHADAAALHESGIRV